MAELLLGLIKLGLLLLAIVLVPLALVLCTPFVLLWPNRSEMTWKQVVFTRYGKVARSVWFVSEAIGAIVPD